MIAGKARRLALKTVPGMETRPTTDRIKETLFNMIQDDLYHIRFLDLFAGSGAMGIEALSRGAAEAVFVESQKAAVECIKENLNFTRLAQAGTLLHTDVLSALRKLEGGEAFQMIFMDPPYNMEWERKVLEYLSSSDLVCESTLIIVEASKETDMSYVKELNFLIQKEKVYKTNKHIFLRREND